MEKFVSKESCQLPNHVDLESFCDSPARKPWISARASAISKIDATESSVFSEMLRDANPLPPQTNIFPNGPKKKCHPSVKLVENPFQILSRDFFRGERSKLPKVVTGNVGVNYRLNQNGARQWFWNQGLKFFLESSRCEIEPPTK